MNLVDDRGSSTAEFAVLLPIMVLMLSLLLGFGVLGIGQIQVQQAAGAMARELARGEQPATAHATGQRLAGPSAHLTLQQGGQYATVTVARSIQLPLVGAITVTGRASVPRER